MMKSILKYLAVFLAATGTGFCLSQSSITQYGITWTFDKSYETGRYVNGDWWVKGPVKINSVSPTPTATRNGSVVGIVGGEQSYDSRGANFNASRMVSFPYTLAAGKSMVSTYSNPDQTNCTHGGGQGWIDYKGSCGRGIMKTQAVLTCVSSAPAANAFRPPFAGSSFYPNNYNTSSIDWSKLPSAGATPKQEDIATMLRWFQRPFVDHQNGWTTQYTHAMDNFCGYGTCIVSKISMAAVYMMLDVPRKDELAIRMIQLGLDNYGLLKAGARWPADGGHASGRKFPILFAGVMLNDASMKNVGRDYGPSSFGEDCQTYYDGSVARWGIRHCQDPSNANYNDESNSYRTCCTSVYWPGQALACDMMGIRGLWNHDAFFDYTERWTVEEGTYGDSYVNGFFIKFAWIWYWEKPFTTDIEDMKDAVIALNVSGANPARGDVTFLLAGKEGAVKIYNATGQPVKQLVPIGSTQQVIWDRTDSFGKNVMPGVYYYTASSANGVSSGRIMVVE